MAAFSSTLFVVLSILDMISNAAKYGDCSYIIEPNEGIYNNELSSTYQNIIIPTRAYTMGYCNYYLDWQNGNREIAYKYECDSINDEVTVSLYPGAKVCSGSPSTYTYTRTNNDDVEWYCGFDDCTLTIERYDSDNTTCNSNFLLNRYSIINGQCEYASDLSQGSPYEQYLQASCYDTSSYMYGIYQDTPSCSGQGIQHKKSPICKFQGYKM